MRGKGNFKLSIDMPIGTQLKTVRKKFGITLETLSQTMGTDAPHLSRIENNNPMYQPTLPTIVSYLKALGYTEISIQI